MTWYQELDVIKDNLPALYPGRTYRPISRTHPVGLLAAGRPTLVIDLTSDLTITELVLRHWEFAQGYYVKNGKPTGAIFGIKVVLRLLRESYGRTRAFDFGPLALKSLQNKMIEMDHARSYINDNIGRIRRVFKWATSEELIPGAVYQDRIAVQGLKKNRSLARETPPVRAVEDEVVDATLPFMRPIVADMVRFQKLTACRPSEVRLIRPCDVNRSGQVWCYIPKSHKTEHHDRQRLVFIGPRAQKVIRPYLLRENTAFCFSPSVLGIERWIVRSTDQQRSACK